MLHVTPHISIGEREIREEFVRASGPGGQNINKVATAVKLRFDVLSSPSLPEEVRARLMVLAGKKISREGVLVIDARRFRTQERNRKDAVDRLIQLIQRAARKPKFRLRTRPTLASRERRLDTKRRRSDTKRLRQPLKDSF
jgi:ribosome-associated protein